MRKAYAVIAIMAASMLAGCTRVAAPEKDMTGVTPTGQTLTVRITADAVRAFLSLKRGDALPINQDNMPLPYEQVFNVRSGDSFNIAAGAGEPGKSVKANLRIVIIYNGQEVASGVESNLAPAMGGGFPSATGTTAAYIANCAFTVP